MAIYVLCEYSELALYINDVLAKVHAINAKQNSTKLGQATKIDTTNEFKITQH
jgi:hypothetical protein